MYPTIMIKSIINTINKYNIVLFDKGILSTLLFFIICGFFVVVVLRSLKLLFSLYEFTGGIGCSIPHNSGKMSIHNK